MNMFKGLLFLHGHFTRPEDLEDTPVAGRSEYGARTAADDFARPLGNRAASAAWFGRDTGKSPQASAHAGFLDRLMLLGGRPMHAGHNLDVEEPFELFAGESGTAGATPRREKNAASSRPVSAQPCAG